MNINTQKDAKLAKRVTEYKEMRMTQVNKKIQIKHIKTT